MAAADRSMLDDGQGAIVRPYLLTGGRTEARLAIEARVCTVPGVLAAPGLTPEERAILQLCSSWLAVAEVSAHLRLPVGVVRVLVSDLVERGLMDAARTARPQGSNGVDVRLVERLIAGVRRQL